MWSEATSLHNQCYACLQFEILEAPSYGRLRLVDMPNDESVERFSYVDILNQRLLYAHDGSETLDDSFDFKVCLIMKIIE